MLSSRLQRINSSVAKNKKFKGKAQRRYKQWHSSFVEGLDVDSLAGDRQKFSGKGVKLREDSYSDTAADLEHLRKVEGMVTGVFQRGVLVRCAEFTDDLFCSLAKTYRPPEGSENYSPLTIGDDVTVALVQEEHAGGQLELDRNRMDGMVLSRSPRRSLLARPQPRSRKRNDEYADDAQVKVIAANMDTLLIVAAVEQPKFKLPLIERFLIAARRGYMKPIIVINKCDLGEVDDDVFAEIRESQDLEIVRTSASTGRGMDELRELLRGRRCVLTGASGVGKSTLVNYVVPHANAATRDVRAKDERGRHTTSQAKIYDLECGGLLVDTPGIRELGLDMTPEELCWYFPEIEEFATACKFSDCTHTHEPGCAVIAAVEEEKIPPRRYESYLRILDTMM